MISILLFILTSFLHCKFKKKSRATNLQKIPHLQSKRKITTKILVIENEQTKKLLHL